MSLIRDISVRITIVYESSQHILARKEETELINYFFVILFSWMLRIQIAKENYRGSESFWLFCSKFPTNSDWLKVYDAPSTYLAKILLFILTGFTFCPHFTRIKVKLLHSYSHSHDYAVVAFP